MSTKKRSMFGRRYPERYKPCHALGLGRSTRAAATWARTCAGPPDPAPFPDFGHVRGRSPAQVAPRTWPRSNAVTNAAAAPCFFFTKAGFLKTHAPSTKKHRYLPRLPPPYRRTAPGPMGSGWTTRRTAGNSTPSPTLPASHLKNPGAPDCGESGPPGFMSNRGGPRRRALRRGQLTT